MPTGKPKKLDRMPAPVHLGAMLIYKILRGDEWRALKADGDTAGAPVDRADGFVHFSTARQAA